jgi:hypothetical protein
VNPFTFHDLATGRIPQKLTEQEKEVMAQALDDYIEGLRESDLPREDPGALAKIEDAGNSIARKLGL